MENNQEEKNEVQVLDKDQMLAKPADDVEFGNKAASILKDIVEQANLIQKIQGNDYIKFEGWQTIAKFYNCTAGTEWTKPVMEGDKVAGWEARSYVKNEHGQIISSAESYCGRDEPQWKDKLNYAIRSMAQTRASAKALRQVFSWVVALAGYKPTPAEEMQGINQEKAVSTVQIPPYSDDIPCYNCGCDDMGEKVYQFSMKKEGKPICFKCQKIPEEKREYNGEKMLRESNSQQKIQDAEVVEGKETN